MIVLFIPVFITLRYGIVIRILPTRHYRVRHCHNFQWWSATKSQNSKWSTSLKRLRTAGLRRSYVHFYSFTILHIYIFFQMFCIDVCIYVLFLQLLLCVNFFSCPCDKLSLYIINKIKYIINVTDF